MSVEQTEKGFNLDVPLPEEITQLLKQPVCADISLPEPASVSLKLPNGSSIKGIGDVTQGIPTSCSLNFSLLLQLGPILANLECFIKLLKLIEPLIDVVKGLPFPPVEAIKKFVEASADVGVCIASLTTPLGMLPFAKDIVCLIIRTLTCLIEAMKSILALMEKLSLDMIAAAGNPTQQAIIQCAQENAQRSAQAQLQAIEPVMVIMDIAAPIFEIAQVGPIEIPTFDNVEGIDGVKNFIETVEGVLATLELIVGGCD
ncbi:MAG: hypothetical protein AAFZ92_06375 [Pseudomonadota bacterium]